MLSATLSLLLSIALVQEPAAPATQPAAGDTPVVLARASQHTVTAPDGYSYVISIAEPSQPAPKEGYAVLYVLDANQNFLTAVQTARFQKGVVPLVIVGIGHVGEKPDTARRYHDFTPKTPQENIVQNPQAPTQVKAEITGGEDAFFAFLTTQAKPEIEKRFAINPKQQAIYGHSLSARFVLHVLASRPEEFSTYIAASPSIWWNKASLLEDLKQLKALTGPTTVFIGVGETEQASPAFEPLERKALLQSLKMVDNAEAAANLLRPLAGATVHFHVFDGENHGSSAPMSLAKAIRLTLSNQK